MLKALTALGLSIVIGNEPAGASKQATPTSNLDDVFARLTVRDPLLLPDSGDKSSSKKASGRRR